MAIKLIANYSKRLGLPGYSSHQFSVSVETELINVDDVSGESERLYALLQGSVDTQIQKTGFVPPDGYGLGSKAGNGHQEKPTANGNGAWRCSEKQQGLIEKIVAEHQLDKREVEDLAIELFGVGVKQLDKLQASGLIDELLERHGNRRQERRPYRRNRTPVRGGRG